MLDDDISVYKTGLLKEYEELVEQEFAFEKSKLKREIGEQVSLFGNSENNTLTILQSNLLDIETQEDFKKNNLREKVAVSNYFVERISILHSKYPATWLITCCFMLIFLLPSALKNLIPTNTRFYSFKRNIEVGLVEDEYKKFKSLYSSIMRFKFGENYTFQEIYLDPPFNTKRKKDLRTFKKESDLISELYNA
ncbi:hypothetical protein GCM10023183_11620 [Nibribacter koreensis]|uniref:Uncharacterized protein n=2 Tax=Nibribacter koreensis TaxID=1084519 RepID=A0ABP8FDX5_9BACT